MLAVGDCAHVQLVALALTASLASLISAGISDADSGPRWSLRFDALAKN